MRPKALPDRFPHSPVDERFQRSAASRSVSSEIDADIAAHVAAADPHTGYQKESEKGQANGYASLDAGTKVPTAQLGGAGADGTKFLRGDQTWQVVAVTGGSGWDAGEVTDDNNTIIGIDLGGV